MGTWGWLVTKQAIERKTKESSWWTTTRANNISKVIDKGYFMFLASAIPLHMPIWQMIVFCGIGFIVVMFVLSALSIFTSLIGRVFSASEKK